MVELTNLLTSNIWLIALLIVMFIRRPYRILAMIILSTKAAFGITPSWLIIIMIIVGIFLDIEQYSRTYTLVHNHVKKDH